MICITEGGLYQLVFSSHLPIAKEFQKWVFEEVLPTIRTTGSYESPNVINKQIFLRNETDLHYKVIHLIRSRYPEFIIIAGLGEHQKTADMRTDAYHKGYMGGQPDILITNYHKKYDGLAIELKNSNGNGNLSDNQELYLKLLKMNKYEILVSDDFDEISCEIRDYAQDIPVLCEYCGQKFKTLDTVASHAKYFHKNKIAVCDLLKNTNFSFVSPKKTTL
jgi:hypothetical protein